MLTKSIESVSNLLKNNKIAPAELYDLCLKRIEFTKNLNSFVTVLKHRRPSETEIENNISSLKDIPIAVKDNFCTKGIKTTCASPMLQDFIPTYNATVVERLIEKGAAVIGKCNLDEFAMGSGTVDSLHGETKNVWRSDVPYSIDGKKSTKKTDWRIAGGSSGGSAVAVATGACFAALGSDTGGSVRNPASHCGIIGFKPTYSTVSRHGLIPLVNSMDVPGILARSVSDVAIVYNAIRGHDQLDSTTVSDELLPGGECEPSKLKIGIPDEYYAAGISNEMLSAWNEVASVFEKYGATLQRVSLPHTLYSISCYSVLNQAEVSSNMARYDSLRYGLRTEETSSVDSMYADARSTGLGQVVRARILAGNYFLLKNNYANYFEKALKVRRLITNDFQKAWESVDFLLTPTTLTEAPRVSDFTGLDNREQTCREDYCTQPANLAGCPAISLPVKLSSNELPLSVQLISRNYSDLRLLTIAAWLQERLHFPKLNILDT